MKKVMSRFVYVLSAICISLSILSFSIGVPIYWKGFYYLHIDTLNLPERTGFTYDEIKTAYDDLLDYLTRGGEFGTGTLAWSESGKSHFEDCKKLFDLDLYVFVATTALAVIFEILRRKSFSVHFLRSPCFYGGIAAMIFPVALGIFAAADFDAAFTLFHKLFFPGKDNWIFNPYYDEIIKILPEEYFADCGIFILSCVIIISVICIVLGRKRKHD